VQRRLMSGRHPFVQKKTPPIPGGAFFNFQNKLQPRLQASNQLPSFESILIP
jgi:hypothetical protein